MVHRNIINALMSTKQHKYQDYFVNQKKKTFHLSKIRIRKRRTNPEQSIFENDGI